MEQSFKKQRNMVRRLKELVMLFVLVFMPIGAWAQDGVKYMAFDEATGQFVERTCTDGIPLTSTSYDWADGNTYVVSGNVIISSCISLSSNGSASLILCDGATLTASKGIEVKSGSTLTIYAQSEGTGTLVASGYTESDEMNATSWFGAAIGGSSYETLNGSVPTGCGAIYIHGGQITADASSVSIAAGIGGCDSDGGTVVVYGGTVVAKGPESGVGIGAGGSGNNNGTLTLGAGVTCFGGNSADPTENVVDGPTANVTTRYRNMKIAPTDYGITVGGIPVTSANAKNITGENITTGTIKFDTNSNMLTLDGATVIGTYIGGGCIISKRSNLTINLIGSNTLDCENDSCTAIRADMEGAQTLTIVKGAEDCSLKFMGSRAIRDFSTVTLTGLYWDNLYTYKEATIEGSTGKKLVDLEGEWEVGYALLNDVEAYDLTVYGIRVNKNNARDILFGNNIEGLASFDADYNILTLDNVVYLPGGICSALNSLTIKVKGVNKLYSEVPSTISYVGNGTGSLTFVKDTEAQGTSSLLLENYDHQTIISGFSSFNYDGFYLYSDSLGVTYDVQQKSLNDVKGDAVSGALFSTAETYYDLTVCGIAVTNENADNVLNDTEKTVRFDSETNTLTLRNASLSTDGYVQPVVTGITDFTVNLIGSNFIGGQAEYAFVLYESQVSAPTLTFTTDANHPGKLQWSLPELITDAEVNYENGLGLRDGSIISVLPVGYGLTVGDVEVTNVNADNVLEDAGKTVTFDASTSTLTLDGASVSGDIALLSTSGISQLTVKLKGTSTITGQFAAMLAETSRSLSFITDPNSPGTLNLIGHTNLNYYTGFNPVTFENGLIFKNDDLGSNNSTISTFTLIDPIVDEDEPNKVVVIDNRDGSYDNLDGVVINDIYYTLGSGEGGYDNGGITIGYGMTDAEVEAAVNGRKPGDPGFTAFRGITLMVPAGIGTLTIRAKAENGGVLKVKVGSSPATAANVSGDEGDVVIGYNCAEPTYIYLYVLATSSVRGDSPHRGKVQTATVKVSSYSGRSQAVCTSAGGSNTATVYSCSSVGYSTGDTSVTMSSVSVPASSGSSTASPARGARQPADDMVEFKITALGDDVFNEITDKDAICYIDLSRTGISNFVVNRDGGVLKGFGNRTLVCLPDGNDDGWEPNAVVGNSCSDLQLDQSFSFLAPKIAFTASKAELNRTFTAGQTSTIILPFDIPASDAALMGNFYRFKEISGNDAVYEPVSGDLVANTPYIFVPAGTSVSFSNVAVRGNDDVKGSDSEGVMWGTYERIDWDGSQTDVFGFAASPSTADNIAAGEFVRIGSGSWTLPFRAYIKTSLPSASRLRLVIDGEHQTGISVIASDGKPAAGWFSLDGRRLGGQPTVPGLYINNGVKVMVK